jgi:hypothetical protein
VTGQASTLTPPLGNGWRAPFAFPLTDDRYLRRPLRPSRSTVFTLARYDRPPIAVAGPSPIAPFATPARRPDVEPARSAPNKGRGVEVAAQRTHHDGAAVGGHRGAGAVAGDERRRLGVTLRSRRGHC